MEQQNSLLYNSCIYNIPRKCNLLPLVPYKGTYHILLNRIHTSCTTEVISSYIFIGGNQLWTGDFVM